MKRLTTACLLLLAPPVIAGPLGTFNDPCTGDSQCSPYTSAGTPLYHGGNGTNPGPVNDVIGSESIFDILSLTASRTDTDLIVNIVTRFVPDSYTYPNSDYGDLLLSISGWHPYGAAPYDQDTAGNSGTTWDFVIATDGGQVYQNAALANSDDGAPCVRVPWGVRGTSPTPGPLLGRTGRAGPPPGPGRPPTGPQRGPLGLHQDLPEFDGPAVAVGGLLEVAQFAQEVGVAQGVGGLAEAEVRQPVVMHRDAFKDGQEAGRRHRLPAPLGVDRVEGVAGGPRHMQPQGTATDPNPALVEVGHVRRQDGLSAGLVGSARRGRRLPDPGLDHPVREPHPVLVGDDLRRPRQPHEVPVH